MQVMWDKNTMFFSFRQLCNVYDGQKIIKCSSGYQDNAFVSFLGSVNKMCFGRKL